MNLYLYANQNPANYIDPDGQFFIAAAIVHWTRNYWNEPVQDISDVNEWTPLTPDESIYHTMGPGNENNRKFVSPGGHSEAVFDSNDCLVTDPANMGTFNFFGPRTLGGVPHLIADVLPYFVLGSSPSDMFNMDRFTTTIKHLSK